MNTAAPCIVHVLHSLGIGGLENGVVNVINGLSSAFRHAVISLTPERAWRSRVASDVEIIVLRKAPGQDVRTLACLVSNLRRLHPAIVHTRNWGTLDAVLAARLAGVTTVIHGEHGRDITDPDGLNRRRNRLRRIIAPLVTRFVTVSDDLRRWLIDAVGISPRKVITLHNGVDTDRFCPGDPSAVRRALRLPSGRRVVGTVGRLDPVKNHAGLIEAFARVRVSNPDTLLLIAGDGPCRVPLDALIASLNLSAADVRLLGPSSTVPDFLRALDVFVMPSIAEGLSNTILEAMATGLPVVATRVGGTPELIEHGVNGLLVPRGDCSALATAIARYLDSPHLRLHHGNASRRRVTEQFSLTTMYDAYARLYHDALHRKASSLSCAG